MTYCGFRAGLKVWSKLKLLGNVGKREEFHNAFAHMANIKMRPNYTR